MKTAVAFDDFGRECATAEERLHGRFASKARPRLNSNQTIESELAKFCIHAGSGRWLLDHRYRRTVFTYLLENNFKIAVGDPDGGRAFASLRFEDSSVAVEVKNLTTGMTLTLRDENGRPLRNPGPAYRPRF